MNHLINQEAIASCLSRLRQRKTHEHFAGYLCLQYRAASAGRNDSLDPNFVSFFDQFFRVEGSPAGNPYIKPFIKTPPTESNLWLNKNVAGSYAPSSIRSTFKKVVGVKNGKYSLRKNHAQMALEHLLCGVQINAFDLAIFLYRDYPLVGDAITINDFVEVFEIEFGYRMSNGNLNSDFNTLFSKELPQGITDDSIEKYESA